MVSAPAMLTNQQIKAMLLSPDGVFNENGEDVWDDDGTWRGDGGFEPEFSVEVLHMTTEPADISLSVWEDNTIQFPRLIAELEAAGAFTPEVLNSLRESMDLKSDEVSELITRATDKWDEIVDKWDDIVSKS